jgi:pyruvate/2-oxoglutarate dehydrogenase complex dihydrolipoamide dehydrogenase (E3) component
MPKYDICIIGAGSGGLSLAAGAAQLGLSVALIEADKMGGDCLNYGCVPSKALLAAGKAAHLGAVAGKFGIKYAAPEIDFSAVKDHVAKVIAAIEPNDSVERFESFGCVVIKGRAKFISPTEIVVGDQKISARHFVIATGSHASAPPIPGLSETPYLTNETIFALRDKPAHLIIIGGGPIGCEMAQAHVRLGCTITLLEGGSSIMGKDDPELVSVVRETLSAEGIKIIEAVKITAIRKTDAGVEVETSAGIISGSHLLVAAGRVANVKNLGLEAAGIKFSPRGIDVDAGLRTNVKNIYAIGDCRVGPQFTHAAGYEAGILVRRICFKLPAKVNYAALPWVTFTDPEFAHVGLNEVQAREKFPDIKVLRWPYHENDRAQAEGRTQGLVKVIIHKNKILGASIVGLQAGELIHSWAIAISSGLSVTQMASYISPYPTLSEVNKRAAGSAFTDKLFSPRTRKIVGWLQKLPF